MSSVRMCDRCGNIFSEREEGWETYQTTQMKTVDGIQRSVSVHLDACPSCALGSSDTPVPMPKLGGMDGDFFNRQKEIEASKKEKPATDG